MSIVKLRKGVRKQIKFKLFGRTFEFGSAMAIILWIIVLIFVVGTYYMYGTGDGAQGPRGQQATTRNVNPVVAKADNTAISRQEYEFRVAYARNAQNSSDITRTRYLKTDILDSLVDRELQRAAAKAEGIKVTNADVAAKKDELVEDMITNQYADKTLLHKVLKERNVSLEQFKKQLRDDPDRIPDNPELREMLLFEKLQESIEESVSVTETEVRDSYREVRARHILISPDTISAEASATEDETDETDETEAAPETMTEEEAKTKAREIAEDLKKQLDEGADFAKLAEEHSDDPGSAVKGGDLDFFTRERMVKEFSDVAFALEPGQISDPVESQFGIHIIKVEETRQTLPEDFDTNKQQYTDEVTEKLQGQAWTQYAQDLRDAATVEILDPELQAYDLMKKDPDKSVGAAAQLLAIAAEQDPLNDSAKYELAMLLERGGQTDEAIAALTELAESEYGARSPQVHMALAKMLKDAERNEDAVEHFKSASEWAQGFDYQNYFVHMEAQRLLTEIGELEAAALEQEWLDDFNEQMGRGMGGPGNIQVN